MFSNDTIRMFFPFVIWLKMITPATLRADLIAGMTGAVIVLPQGIAFAAIAGLPPEYGLYTAMVTPIIAALFGSSLHLVSGPTTAISIVIFSAVSNFAEPGSEEYIRFVLTLTFLAGVYQLAFGLARLGSLVNFVSHTVIIGFTAGAAVLIMTSQLSTVLGVSITLGQSFIDTWFQMFSRIDETNIIVLFVALITVVVAIGSKLAWSRSPHLLLGLIAGTLVGLVLSSPLNELKLVGYVPATLPPFSLPELSWFNIKQLAPEAFAVALLGLIEAVSISRSIASRSHQRIESNQEFIGQGLSNIVGSFFSSYAGSGSFTRSGLNYDAGACTPLSAIFSAIILMLVIVLVAPYMAYIPLAAMGGIIFLVAYNLIEVAYIRRVLNSGKTESSILLTTFFATLFLELEFAIYLGVLLSLVLFLARTSTPKLIALAPDAENEHRHMVNVRLNPVLQCPQLKVLRIDMSIYFGSLVSVQEGLDQILEKEGVKHIIIIGTSINFIDFAGAEMLVQQQRKMKQCGGQIYFAGLKLRVFYALKKWGVVDDIGEEWFFFDMKSAISTIYQHLDKTTCQQCNARIFTECDEVDRPPQLLQ